MKKVALLSLLTTLVLLTAGCGQTDAKPIIDATVQPTFPIDTVQTETRSPSTSSAPIPEPKHTRPEPTATDAQEVISGGLSSPPYLVYVKKNNAKEQIVLVNQDGSGLKVIPLPAGGFHAGNLSPTGEWIVFYSSPGGDTTAIDTSAFDLSSNLMHLPDGSIREVTGLLSEDYPDNIEKIAEMAQSNDPELSDMPLEEIVPGVQEFFAYSLFFVDWSPSGDYLAFSGEMDGPSTDLYLYNIHSNEIRRLSSGFKNIDFIEWFPGGDQIVYSSSSMFCMGDCSSYYVTNLDGSISKTINNFDTFGGATFMSNWATGSLLTVHTDANVTGTCCLRNFDFENDKVNLLYGGSFQEYAYDPQTNILAISIADNLENREPGTYFIDQNGMRKIAECQAVYYLGWPNYPFILSGEDTRLLSSSGETKILIEQGLVPSASRNNRYIALFDGEWSEDANGLKVLDNNGDILLEIANQKVTRVIWRIDSEGLFYITDNQLFYVGIQNQTPVLIDPSINSLETDTIYTSFDWVR